MTKPDLDARVKLRLTESESLRRYKRKVYNLRRLVAGDFSQVLGTASAAQQGRGDADEWNLDEFYTFIMTSFEEGYSNRMLQVVKQMLMKVSYAAADVEFEDLSPRLAQLHSQYVKRRWAQEPIGCGARDAMRIAFLDFLTGGFGWSYVCKKTDVPVLTHADTLQMNWDRDATVPSMMRWNSCQYPMTIGEALSLFGSKAIPDQTIDTAERLSEHITLEYYYDRDSGPRGKMYVVKANPLQGPGHIVHQQDTPCFFEIAGRTVPYLPYTAMYFMALPSCSEPIGLVEMMFPDQLSLWGIEDYKRTARERGKPFFEAKKGSMDAEEEKKFADGEMGAVVKTETGNDIAPREGLKVPAELYEDQQYHEKQLMAHAGLNPYGLGAPPEGISYSSEVKEISGASDLTSAYIGEDHAIWWAQTARKFIAFGAQNDDVPIVISMDGMPLLFDAYKPIKNYLRPDADVVVSADKMAFRPRMQRIQEAQRDLQVATAYAKQYPNALAAAFEDYWRAVGKKDIASLMAPPDPATAMAMGAGMATGAGAGDAMASSA
jgi:hypothetical protein